MQIITFGEFLTRWQSGSSLIGPVDFETRSPFELGVINGRFWSPITFSPILENLTGAYVRSQIQEYCENLSITLSEEQMREAAEAVGYAVTDMIGDCIDTALDVLELDREIVILQAWAVRDEEKGFGDIFTDRNDAVANGYSDSDLIKGFTIGGGAAIRALTEELFRDFYENKDEINDILTENGLVKFVNDLSGE
jgi:hypothetical protein